MSSSGNKNNHEAFMRRALLLALRGRGRTAPNPIVGAVVVNGSKIVGAGFHRRAGTPHAEVHALRAAGRRARGASLYVTLEPCAHVGRTPPCTGAIIASGIARVIVGAIDPNPLVCGRGIARLRRAGISVVTGVLKQDCEALIQEYASWVVHRRPFVTCKVAMTIDGKIATAAGESRWITGERCRRYVHWLRAGADAILVGAGTVARDDPRLSIRLHRREYRKRVVVVDSRLRLPAARRLHRRPPGELIVATTRRASVARLAALKRQGHKVMVCQATADGRVDLRSLLAALGREGMTHLMVEGGGEVLSSLMARRLIDRLVVCIGPMALGGNALDFLPTFSVRGLVKAPRFRLRGVERYDDDLVVTYQPLNH